MIERRKHKRFPVIRDMAEPIEIAVTDPETKDTSHIPGVLTNFSAGGMDLVLMGSIKGKPSIRLSLHLPGFDRFEVEGRVVWTKPKGITEIVGLQFTKIDKDHSHQITHMAEAYWECEDRIRKKAPMICFHGCSYWDLCEKNDKLSNGSSPVATETRTKRKNSIGSANSAKTRKKISSPKNRG